MTEKELQEYLIDNFPVENEACEWKEFKNLKNDFCGKEKDDVVSYVSALSNMEGGTLVIGVEDQTLDIVGIDTYNYDVEKARLRLVSQCANLPSEGLDVKEYITSDTKKVVWVITVPKHPFRKAVIAHSKAWQRIEDSLIELTESRSQAIINETVEIDDWSAKVVPDATIADLDPRAIAVAREKYIELHSDREDEIREWNDEKFLNKAGITRQGKITNTAIILLGREESQHFLSPVVCKIRWCLKQEGMDMNKDFQIFTIPMILAIEKFANKVRNTQYTYTIQGSLFPESMYRYDVFTIREPLNNAIAHQDYSKQRIIDITEYEDNKLMFRNAGQFIPKSIDDVVKNDFPESLYRNPFLVEAMRNIKMVDNEGGGIRKLFLQQKKRFFPMPHYDTSNNEVLCEIEGKVLDENFAIILANNPDLTLTDIMLLDKVQKHQPISEDAIKALRKKKFIEGKRPNIYLSHSVVSKTNNVGLQASYIKNKSFDDKYYKELIVNYIKNFGSAGREDLKTLLYSKLPETLDEKQKFDKVTNLLASLKRAKIITIGTGRRWVLVNKAK